MVEHLDYLHDLGINAIYFTPIFQSASNHRYHTHDYEKVDPMLGGNAALRRLIDEAHARGIRVVLDGVFNHASRGFFQFHDIMENGPNSAYLDWFHVNGFPLNAYDTEKTAQLRGLVGPARPAQVQHRLPRGPRVPLGDRPEVDRLRHRRLAARRRPTRSTTTRSGASSGAGSRQANPEAYIVGEVWTDAPRWLQGDMWDAVMNYQFTRACIAFFIGEDVDEQELRRTSLYPPARPAPRPSEGRSSG